MPKLGLLLIPVIAVHAASVFSTRSLGEDRSAFAYFFADPGPRSSMTFSTNPVYNILYQSGDYRGSFWINPLSFNLHVMLPGRSALRLSLDDRFNQNFDIYTSPVTAGSHQFQRHIIGRGGINAATVAVSKVWFEKFMTGVAAQPLFGTSQELWEFTLVNSGYTVTDTITYRYTGSCYAACAGVRTNRVTLQCYGEAGPDLTVKYTTGPNTSRRQIPLPQRYGAIMSVPLGRYLLRLQVEQSRWSDNTLRDPLRFRLEAASGRNRLAYRYEPWYIDGVVEHGLIYTRALPIAKVGGINLAMNLGLRNRGDLYELSINPSLDLRFEEIFALRRK